MEMIGHQAIGKNIRIWHEMNAHFFKEKRIVIFREKHCLSVVSLIKHVECAMGDKFHSVGILG